MIRSFRKNFITPPYRLMPYGVFVYFVANFLLNPMSPIYTSHLNDSDDYMRLNEVINWLQGQGWYDLSQPRLSPGAHTVVHWARLVDLPIAALMLPFLSFLGMQKAALLAAFIVPPLLFILLLWLTTALAKPLIGETRANLASILLLFMPMTLFNFAPGRVDHHNWQILIAGFGLCALPSILGKKTGWHFSVFTAAAFACGLWIGTEALPWLLLFLTCLSFFAAWQGGHALRNAAIFGFAFALATTIILPLALPPDEWHSRALSWFSSADVIFAWLACGVLGVSWLLGKQSDDKILCFGLLAVLGTFAAALLVFVVPNVINGPFADYDDFNATVALDNIDEARPYLKDLIIDLQNPFTAIQSASTFFHILFLPVLALGASLWASVRSRKSERTVWIIQSVFLLTAILLATLWQRRVGWFMQFFAIAPLAWLIWKWGKSLSGRRHGQKYLWAGVIALLLALTPLPAFLVPALFGKFDLYSEITYEITKPPERRGCSLAPVAALLNEKYGDHPHTIMSGLNEGPELLFTTHHNVIGGNYNVSGNADVRDFFNARDDKAPRKILHQWNADLVLTCRDIAPFLAGLDHPVIGQNAFLHIGADGKLHISGHRDHPALLEKLVEGKAPRWLKQVEIPGSSDYLLFEVQNKGMQ